MEPIVGRFLERRARLDGRREAVVCENRRLTFLEFHRLTGQLAALMRGRGIGRGDRVAALLRNGIELCALYHAVARLGAVLCPVNWRLAVPEAAHILNHCGARLLLFDPDFRDTVGRLPDLPDLRHRLSVGPGDDGGSCARLAGREPIDGPCPARPDDPLLIVYTSGTTGRPKGAVLTQGQMAWSSITMACTLDYRREDIGLIAAPMFHVGGLSFATLFVHLGATAVLTRDWDHDAVLALIDRESINHFFAVATMLEGLARSPRFADTRLDSVRWIMSGGGPLPAALIDRFAARGVPLVHSYGTTETAGPAAVVPRSEATAKAGTSGLPFFHTDLRIVDGSGNDVTGKASGEIHVRAPHLSAGYWNDEEATDAAFDGPWFRTGDEGYVDGEGYLHVEGRMEEMIITGGENVYPAEIERVLQTHPRVADVAVIGIPDSRWGEVICAVAYPADGEPLTLADLLAGCAGRLARYKHPKRLVVRADPLPRNPMGKLLRDSIRRSIIG